MLWQNAFLDTRWRFLVGLVLLTVSAMFVALGYPHVAAVAKAAPAAPAGGPLGREIAEALALSRTYDGYVWSQWFRQNGAQLGSFFAVIIGTGGLLSQSSAARLFTLSLPVSRERLLGARAAAGLAQVLALSVVPALAITLVSPLVGQQLSAARYARLRAVPLRRLRRLLQRRVPAVDDVRQRLGAGGPGALRRPGGGRGRPDHRRTDGLQPARA